MVSSNSKAARGGLVSAPRKTEGPGRLKPPDAAGKLGVVGAGAVGSMLGGLIKHHCPATDLLLIARGPHGERMRATGRVVLHGPWGTWRVPVRVADDMAQLAGSQTVLLTVKSQVTEAAIRAARPHLAAATVISIQNGINQRTLSRYLAPSRLVMGTTATNMAVFEPGSVTMQRSGVTIVGPGSPETPARTVQQAAELLRTSGLRVATEENILGAQYNKLVFNVLGCAALLSASDYFGEAILYTPWRNAVAVPLHDECLRVFRRAGVELARTPSLSDALRFGRLLRLLDRRPIGLVLSPVIRKLFHRRPIYFSAYADLLRGKPTEIDFINGQVVRLAEAHGLQAPFNRKVVEIAHELERRGDGTFFSREEVIARFQQLASGAST